MKKPKIIKKTLNYHPNLENYEKTYNSFIWRDAYKELSWFDNRYINAAYNAIDRNALNWRKNKVAMYWEGEEGKKGVYTFADLSKLSNKVANVLKDLGLERGERVFIFLPRVPELFYSFLGILKTGGVAGTLFSAFAEQALVDRIGSSGAKFLITNSELLERVIKVRAKLPNLKKTLVIDTDTHREDVLSFKRLVNEASDEFRVARMKLTDPAFILYTSGTTGKPKGVVHTHKAILLEHMTAKWVLDLREDDVYWCTADPGWVTGIAYSILGSWSLGASSVVYSGRFDPEKWYQIIGDYKVNVWYTAPTAIRMLAAKTPKEILKKFDFSSLRHLCSVGEPLNPEAIWWGLDAFGLPFHDNWWQTETGGILIANYPCLNIKVGSMGKPVPGIVAGIVNDKGQEVKVNEIGNLAIRPGWPGMMKTFWRRPAKYKKCFVNNWYITGDLAYKDKDGYFWFVGRADDVIKTSGERVGPFEVESALVEHPAVAEAGVIGKPDPIRGEIIKAFIALKPGFKASKKLEEDIQIHVKKHLAGHAYPREIEFIDSLPKTRSGKIVRRLLKARELGLPVGDTSTLERF